MNGIHDMGGMHGFGEVTHEENEPVFHESWEGRVMGIRRSLVKHKIFEPYNFRFTVESLSPSEYLNSSYYERHLRAAENGAIAKGFITKEEMDERMEFFRQNPDALPERREDPKESEQIQKITFMLEPLHRDTGATPGFNVGDVVRARNINPQGHTRLPRYIRGKTGIVVKYYGNHDFPDIDMNGNKSEPQPIYSVQFDAEELWGATAEVNQLLFIDMWEGYIEPA
jgi:nitrile hydratase beta subunit